jgi:transposase, IS5 family
MNQISLPQTGFELSAKQTRKWIFLEEMQRIILCDILAGLIVKHAYSGLNGRPPLPVPFMLRIHFMRQWFGLTNPAAGEALLHDMPLYRELVHLNAGVSRIPGESVILRFPRWLEERKLANVMCAVLTTILKGRSMLLRVGTAVDTILIAAPSSTNNEDGERGPDVHQTENDTNYCSGMKARLDVDAQSGLFRTVEGAAAKGYDVTKAADLLHGEEKTVLGRRGLSKSHQALGDPKSEACNGK